MNFKTTVVLIVLLAAAAITLIFTRDRGEKPESASPTAKKAKVFDVDTADVNKLAITSGDGKKLALEKSDGKWRLTDPVNAPAEAFEVDSLVRAIASVESRGEVSSKTADAKATGLASPRYTIDLATGGGKSYTLMVGEKTAVGDNLYVSRKAKPGTLVVAADLLEKLDKPAGDYRDKKLVADRPIAGIGQITIAKPDGKIVLAKSGEDWKMTEPTPMPAEKADVDDIVSTLTGLRASEFVSENASDAKLYQLDPPRITATLSGAPATQPTSAPASQPAPLVIKFGAYDDVLRKNVMVMTSQSPVIAKVLATSLETINKKPLELRDKRAVDIDPAQVSSISITSDLAATTRPTSRPASKKEIGLTRHKEPPVLVLAPTSKPAPATTQAATQASTQSSTRPSTPASAATQPAQKWDAGGKAADDSKVDQLITQLHPLRVRKYLEKAPTTQPSATYIVKVTTQAAGGAAPLEHVITLVDPGNSGDVTGTYNGLAFEVDRFLLDKLSGDFLKGSKPASPSHETSPEEPGPGINVN